jgi:glyoxylase I family protein
MSIDHLLAVVPVSDLPTSERWYATLFDRRADNNPMPTLVEWQVVPGGWVQVFADSERAGCRHSPIPTGTRSDSSAVFA